ncbi:MAG: 2-amino-4-hydroxy-6-hydroxymethyldihydropteridine diphosphokinase [Alphaproteobacteria bacterium]|nr:2-amino-4-hydroxy-6-hydroxymethyldihydropteridine diphosphokinase [Alphaproteobacteria bacterium]OJV16281.1 MAG: 2-amino-4-hydroxy-6-hydroxymethyldihydropteridine diphosphokinase [Alphaproteobacteria bacterium 33-17]
MKKEIILALGTNLGNREDNIDNALNLLKENIDIYGVSKNYYNNAMVPEGAPKEWDIEFLNIAIVGSTELSAEGLLDFVLATEVRMGRGDHEKWSPRIIDIDIIIYNNEVYNLPHLKVPHPHYKERDFVMIPLNDIRLLCKSLEF